MKVVAKTGEAFMSAFDEPVLMVCIVCLKYALQVAPGNRVHRGSFAHVQVVKPYGAPRDTHHCGRLRRKAISI